MSEVLRSQPNTSEQLPAKRSREQITFNAAEMMVIAFIKPTEIINMLESNAVTLAIDPELELQKIKEEDLGRYA